MKSEVTLRLGDVASVISGYAFKSSVFGDQGVPVIKIANIRSGYLDFSDTQKVDEENFEKLNEKYRVNPGDILISLTGSHVTQPKSVVGRVAQAPQGLNKCLLNQRAGKVILKRKDRCDPGFLYRYLTAAAAQGAIASMASGAASQANVSPSQVESLPLVLPSLDKQQRIASILSAYDDLIENNTRRIEILEEMARRLYEEWFVHFRFPGHEEVRFKESELGLIPEGWEVVQLNEVSEYISRGISPKYAQSDFKVINQKCIRDNRLNMALSREQVKKVPEAKYVRFGDVLINSTGVGTLGRVAQVYEQLENATVDSHVTIVRPLPEIDFDFFGIGLQVLQPYFESLGVGATGQTELSRVRVGETPVIAPPAELQKKFGELVEPMRRACIKYGVKNTNLRAQRDLLLPKLVSGEVDVSDIPIPDDKEVETA